MFWFFAALTFELFRWGFGKIADLQADKVQADLDKAEDADLQVKIDAADELYGPEGGDGGLHGEIQDEQEAINESQAEINRLALEKVRKETQFDLWQMERQMDARLASGRAIRGVSGLTSAGSPALVRQEMAAQYQKIIQFRTDIGGIQEAQIEEGGEIIANQGDILALQGQIRGVEAKLARSGLEFQQATFNVQREVRGIEQRYHDISTLLDIGSSTVQFGFDLSRTRIPGMKSPLKSTGVGYAGTRGYPRYAF